MPNVAKPFYDVKNKHAATKLYAKEVFGMEELY